MSENVRPYTAAFLLLFLFLLIIPAVSYGAESSASAENSGAPSSPASYVFPAGTSVESLTEQLAPQGAGHILKVLKPDGGVRGSGAIETGDLVEVFDGTGTLLSCVAARVESVSSSPSPSAGSASSGVASSSPASYAFPAGTTVEFLTAQLAPQGTGHILKVLKPDGGVRDSGAIETGDLVEVLDGAGKVLSCVTASVKTTSSSQASSTGSASSGSPFSLWSADGNGFAVFDAGTTVESLQDKLDAESCAGCLLKVKSHAGKISGSGYLCTGDTLSILDSGGKTLESVKAVVPGDLTRCGVPTDAACSLLYSHLTRRSELTGDLLAAADLNRDGTVDTSDLLLLKKAARNFD